MWDSALIKIIKRKLSGIIVAEMIVTEIFSGAFSGLGFTAYAAQGDISETEDTLDTAVSDETMYVNLDPYGKVIKTSVVKAVSSSADMEYMDYGSYTEALNMSNDEELRLTEEGVSFRLKGDGKKFYYEGRLEPESVGLPWSFEISYKLNGMPVRAEDLAGASGLVETDVKVIPRDDCSEYMKNNMILSCFIPVDDEKVYSVDAPGSQTQTVGDMTGVMFTALPGEEKEFAVRLGCNDYESIGVIFLMIPATMDSFDNIKDIKELKDTWKESGDAMYESMDDMLAVTESMREEMTGLKDSLNYMDSARQKASANREAVLDAGDVTVEALTALSGATGKMVPYVSTGKDALEKLDDNFDSTVITLASMQKPLNNMFWGLGSIQDGSDDICADIERLRPYMEEFKAEDAKLQKEISALTGAIEEAMKSLGAGKTVNTADLISEYGLEDTVSEFCEEHDIDEELFYDYLYDKEEGTEDASPSTSRRRNKKYEELEKLLYDEILYSGGAGERDAALISLVELIKNMDETKAVIGSAARQKENLIKIASASQAVVSSADTLLKGVSRTAGGARMVSRELIDLTNDVRNLDAIMGMYYSDLQNSLSDVEGLLGETERTLDSVASSLMLIQRTLRDISDDVDAGLKGSIDSSLSLIEKSMSLFDSVSGIRESGSMMKDTLDRETEKFEEENNFLNIDPSAELQSFTSEKNRTPESIQIIVRSDEISRDEDENEISDAEYEEEEPGILARIGRIFTSIWEAIKGFFK